MSAYTTNSICLSLNERHVCGQKVPGPHYCFLANKYTILAQNCISVLNFVLLFILSNSADLWQWRSQNAEKVTHIKGRLLYQAMILYNYVTFQHGDFS